MPSAEVQPVLLNQRLAKLLQDLPASKRRYKVKSCLENVLRELPEHSLLGRFDVLFHPDYKVDVLAAFVQLAKSRPMTLLWPGAIDADNLTYAEPGYLDYHTYRIKDYDIVCIVEDAL